MGWLGSVVRRGVGVWISNYQDQISSQTLNKRSWDQVWKCFPSVSTVIKGKKAMTHWWPHLWESVNQWNSWQWGAFKEAQLSCFPRNGKSSRAPSLPPPTHHPEPNAARSRLFSGGCWKSFWEMWESSSQSRNRGGSWRERRGSTFPTVQHKKAIVMHLVLK